MRRLAIISSVIAVALLILGLVEWLTNYHWAQGDQNPLFGNPHLLLNDGVTVLIAAGFLLIGSIVMWIIALRRQTPAEPTALRKEQGDRRRS
jgi:hypothetical protein